MSSENENNSKSLEQAGSTNNPHMISPQEIKSCAVLIIEPDGNARNNLRSAVRTLGFKIISDVPTHGQALTRLKERRYHYVFFDSKKTNVRPDDFLRQLLVQDNETIAIPMSDSPRVDDVFDLFVIGAKGFLVKPFTIDTVEQSMIWAAKGEPMSEIVLYAKDRNEALVAVMISALDTVATLLRQSREFDTALKELPGAMRRFMRTAELAQTFCKGTDEELINTILEFCMSRGEGPASRLGRLRKRLNNTREPEETAQTRHD